MDAEMCKQNGLLKRGSTYFFQARVPKDCQPQIGKQVVREKLAATTLPEAKAQVRQKWTEFQLRLEQIRRGTTPDPTDEEIQRYADAWLALRLREDEFIRTQGLTEAAFLELGESMLIDETTGRHHLARGHTEDLEFCMGILLKNEFGVTLNPASPAYRKTAYAFLKADVKANELCAARQRGEIVDTPKAASSAPVAMLKAATSAPLLSEVIRYFLENFVGKDRPMYRKHKSVLPVFLDCVGDRPVDQLKQMDIENFAKLICRLPPRAAPMARQKGLSFAELAELTHHKTIAPKTFEDTFMASVRPFLAASRRIFGDSGFPANLTTDGVVYRGHVKAGGNKQRPMTMDELRQLTSALQPFASNPTEAHKLWLPMVALHTGARINEICQLNPQVDIGERDGIPFFHFTDQTEGDERIRKSIKNPTSRRHVPIHPELIKAGFLDYVDTIRASGAKLLFPQWAPSKRQASPNAEDWFGEFLKISGLRDDTHGRRVVGFHAFRSTFLNRAKTLGVEGAYNITGHTGNTSAVVRRYQDELPLPQKLEILRKIYFDLRWPA